MANSNQKYGVWDSYNDMALSLSPALGNPERCLLQNCINLISAEQWAQGYRTCVHCAVKIANTRYDGNERSEQIINNLADEMQSLGMSVDMDKAREFREQVQNNKFKKALQDAENKAQREEWIEAIPKHWKV